MISDAVDVLVQMGIPHEVIRGIVISIIVNVMKNGDVCICVCCFYRDL
jgi:hypothetical protein